LYLSSSSSSSFAQPSRSLRSRATCAALLFRCVSPVRCCWTQSTRNELATAIQFFTRSSKTTTCQPAMANQNLEDDSDEEVSTGSEDDTDVIANVYRLQGKTALQCSDVISSN